MAYNAVKAIEVLCWGRRVGALALDSRLGFYAFEYEPAWRTSRLEHCPTLRLPRNIRGPRNE
jgi:serine/threonine-protein kinase HipA